MKSLLHRWPWLLAALLCATAAFADDLSTRTFGVGWTNGVPTISFSAADLLARGGVRKMQSGLPQTISMRVYAYTDGESDPVVVAARTCRIVFDLWDEVYRIQVQTVAGESSVTVSSMREVEERCVVAQNLRMGSQSMWAQRRGQQIYFAAALELNPMSADSVERVRRWLSRSPSGRVENDAFFGSVVSVFVNRRVGGAERVLQFRSQSVAVP